MNSLRSIFIMLIIFLIASTAKSQWIPCQGIEGANCYSITVQDSFLFIDGPGGIFRRQIDDPIWDTACLKGGFTKIRSTGNALFTMGGTSPLYRSIDNGFTWDWDFDYNYRNIENVDSVIFLDTYSDVLLRSTDEGENWAEIDPSPNSAEINWIFSQPGILYSNLEDVDSLFMSMDYGDTWTVYPLTGITGEVGQPYLFEQNLWMTKGNNFYIFNDISGEWNIQNDSLPSTVWMSYFIEDNETLCCFTNDGYYRFNQEVSVWEDESQGLENRFCWDACRLDSTIFIATSSGPFSKKGNEYWVPQYDDLFGFNVAKVFNQGSRIFALAKGRIYFSDDITNGFEALESQDYCPPNQMVTTDTSWCLGSNCGFLISVDSGQSWTDYNSGIEGRNVFKVALAQNYFYAEVSQPGGRGLYRTGSDTINWEKLTFELGYYGCYDIDVINNVFFVISGSNSGLYRSTDNGTTFEAIPEVGYYESSRLYVQNNKIFILRDYGDILFSIDSGDSWQTWISGLDEYGVSCMALTAEEETTVLGGYYGPWYPISFMALFNPENPEGLDIKGNLPEYTWNSIDYLMLYNGIIFACPSSGGLWYRDDLAVGMNENEATMHESSSHIVLYPNPATDFINFYLDGSLRQLQYQVIDYSGKMMMKGMLQDGLTVHSVDISGLPQGIYLILIWDENNLTSGKFIKTN